MADNYDIRAYLLLLEHAATTFDRSALKLTRARRVFHGNLIGEVTAFMHCIRSWSACRGQRLAGLA